MATIDTVYTSGLDALANLFNVTMTLENAGAYFPNITADILQYRIQDFEIPGSEVGVYEINYGVWTFDRPNGKVNANRQITLNVRIDKTFEVYQGFANWKNAIQNEYTGVISSLASLTETVEVYPITAVGEDAGVTSDSTIAGARFEKCWPSSIGSVSFDQASGEPLMLSVTMNFLRMNRIINTDPAAPPETIPSADSA